MTSNPKALPISVIVVEDDPRIRSSHVAILASEEEIKCLGSFSSGEQALAAVKKLKPKVVLMDINLPGVDGVECVQQLTDGIDAPHVIMLTVHKDTDAIFNSLAAGASGYLLKPPRATELIAAIKDVFEGGSPMTSYIARKVVQSFKKSRSQKRDETEDLSKREREVMDFLVKGFSYKEIAGQMGISYATVHKHIEHVYSKLHVQSRSQAVAKVLGTA
jgi:DNA-binding NarL/FixJ family response regulator